jgi:hypothetical protein
LLTVFVWTDFAESLENKSTTATARLVSQINLIMDLTQSFPRSPNDKLAGLVHLPRMLDKAKAFNAGTLGEYYFPCPLDDIILGFLQTDSESLAKMVTEKSESEIASWAQNLCDNHSQAEMDAVNLSITGNKPDSQEKIDKFNNLKNKINPDIENILTWVNLIDLEEGRF